MENEKKKPRYSLKSISRYNAKTYDMISCRLPKQLVADFKAKCAEDGISQSHVIREAIEDFLRENK